MGLIFDCAVEYNHCAYGDEDSSVDEMLIIAQLTC